MPAEKSWTQHPGVVWLWKNLQLMPILGAVWYASIILADAHNDERYVAAKDGDDVTKTVAEVREAVTEVQKAQAVSSEKIDNIEANIEDLKKQSDTIEAKIDRLIER